VVLLMGHGFTKPTKTRYGDYFTTQGSVRCNAHNVNTSQKRFISMRRAQLDARSPAAPEDKESAGWTSGAKHRGPGSVIRVQLRGAGCRPCPLCARCTRVRSKYQGRVLALLPQPEHEALAAARAREGTADAKRLYVQRNGIEGTLSQGVCAFGLRRARYRGLAKTDLQRVATAAALNLDRIAAWFAGRPLAPTRTLRFTAPAASPPTPPTGSGHLTK